MKERKIIRFLKKYPGSNIGEISKYTKLHWYTVQSYLNKLIIKKKVTYKVLGKKSKWYVRRK